MALTLFLSLPFLGGYQLSEATFKEVVSDPQHRDLLQGEFASLFVAESSPVRRFVSDVNQRIDGVNEALKAESRWDEVIYTDYAFALIKASIGQDMVGLAGLIAWLIFGFGILGGLLYVIPSSQSQAGVQNNHIFHRSLTSRGFLGWILGVILVAFYVILYWFPAYTASWVILVDGLSEALRGQGADQWFLYGFLYTLFILVLGVRMLIKYRFSRYQLFRTSSVMFFQVAFAFTLPQILVALNLPSIDLKNMWPLDYSFFFDYRIDAMMQAGTLGVFMFVWGAVLFGVGVPVFTYFYGKRWYCSWVCGCGGLAETAGDPFRHLSDKRLIAWKVERWMIHGVWVFTVVMTAAVLYSYFSGDYQLFKLGSHTVSSYDVRGWYGFVIGSAFAGVIGTGFYPLMGNRVWCRFGCPLAAYLGFIQRFKSRFRITTNGGQCISCGNCSTYCEMGIDVRAYAQRGQNIVRSSCVGCGICATVCPRGVLRLENGSDSGDSRTDAKAFVLGNDHIKVNW